jgi:hypothetical protein
MSSPAISANQVTAESIRAEKTNQATVIIRATNRLIANGLKVEVVGFDTGNWIFK